MTVVEFAKLVYFLVSGGLIGGVLADPNAFLHLKILAGIGTVALLAMLVASIP